LALLILEIKAHTSQSVADLQKSYEEVLLSRGYFVLKYCKAILRSVNS